MYNFNYHRATSVDDAVAKLKAAEDGIAVAGGMTIIPTLKQRLASPSDVIDLNGLDELRSVEVSGDTVTIGAMTTHDTVHRSSEIKGVIPVLNEVAGYIGDPQVRNYGTIGGSISNNDPAADYPAALVGLDAKVHTTTRTLSAEEFFTDMFETALEPGELVLKVEFRKPEKAAYKKFANPASRYAMVGVMVAKLPSGVRVAVTGAGPCVFRQTEMEQALASNFSPDAIKDIKVSADGLNSDIHGSAEYRAHLVGVMAKRAIEACG